MITMILGGKTMKRNEMQKFALLGEDKKKQIIDGTHSIRSKQEMHEYVNKINNI